ncbi:MAG: methylase N-4/N-6 domain protein [Candidatus Yanofskybacteria bacterium GW2011_GWA1_48_10]|uniref:Methylase N-4/N-6 domain protein n=1 Tax=Candidatus Yanofskybacteria bacterium GW2011_GWA1_48_10 TaxID=1619022 RepID=A0A0G1U6R2_9BACT|nr:MAG: methylase N-4/N-6 domain protein [Candidatus Yanofskybacteria bacterium GW2011_GWA1_48_10]
MNLNDEQLFERECRYLAFVLQEQGLSLRDLQTDPVSTELVQACCEELHLSREEFDALVSRVIRVLKAADEKSSGQGVVFGTKPVEILLPYLKVLTNRDALVLEPFGGSGSTLIAVLKLKRRCYLMEKSPVYTAVILARWEKFTGQKAAKVA